MKILVDDAGLVTLEQAYPLVYSFSDGKWDPGSDHEKIAAWMNENKEHLSAYMFIVESEYLADEHIDDPKYLQRTNHIGACDAVIEVRRELTNKWFRDEKLDELIKKNNLYTWKYNYKEQPEGERRFKLEIKDALFRFQENREMVLRVMGRLDDTKYKMDEDGYVLEDENEDLVLETDPTVIEQNKKKILDQLLMPKVLTEFKRVYAMPEPFNHWDERSFWHQFFFVENHKTKETIWDRGQGGGSGSREANGRWAHTFAHLEKVFGIKTPTWHLIYNPHNQLVFHAEYDSFKCLPYDLTGNYHWDYKKSDELFEEFIVEPVHQFNF